MKKPSKMQQRLAIPKHLRNNGSVFSKGATARVIPADNTPGVTPADGRRVVFMSRRCVQKYQFAPDDLLISINEPGDISPCLARPPKDTLQLNYVAYPDREERMMGQDFNSARALQVATFLKLNTDTGNIIVHCSHGEQRSCAMGMVLGSYFSLPVYTVSNEMKLINPPERSSAPIDLYAYKLHKALDSIFED